ncbi:helix-turn-helix transcriptional regulator [Mucilaginibacter sp.]|uniref:helix-turn-helix transcriptional regulator n=1 Tax=Mucilaginibacter sp. TaxID=1882438 RepID=UPI00283CBFA9|nr:helix-turn-helix transcriptional regulator [Mucilaginibacter sp.]MDR3696274.1 helix-turn-helix transcriptional regulator [Mucilaginibacter sp.]
MKNKMSDRYELTDFKKLSNEELAEAFIFPSKEPLTVKEKREEEEFWQERRKQFANRTPQQQIYDKLLQLKFQLEDYIGSNQYQAVLNFGYFLNEYVNRQNKQDKEFAAEIDVTPAVFSQYLNNHRKPTEKFVIRLELHSNGMISALAWFKVLQKDKEHEIMTNTGIRIEESRHVKNRLEFAY